MPHTLFKGHPASVYGPLWLQLIASRPSTNSKAYQLVSFLGICPCEAAFLSTRSTFWVLSFSGGVWGELWRVGDSRANLSVWEVEGQGPLAGKDEVALSLLQWVLQQQREVDI